MKELSTINDLKNLLTHTVSQTLYFESNLPNFFILKEIHEQLLFIEKILFLDKRKPDFMETEKISIGAIALKNLDDIMPEYSKALKDIAYCFCEFEEIDFLNNSLED